MQPLHKGVRKVRTKTTLCNIRPDAIPRALAWRHLTATYRDTKEHLSALLHPHTLAPFCVRRAGVERAEHCCTDAMACVDAQLTLLIGHSMRYWESFAQHPLGLRDVLVRKAFLQSCRRRLARSAAALRTALYTIVRERLELGGRSAAAAAAAPTSAQAGTVPPSESASAPSEWSTTPSSRSTLDTR